ncbi:hypothetical protein IR085_02935 [Gemella palaticanis]|uniref:Histidine kinase n=2 Tax=Gemelliphila palaticanis TaxID=81950 RepID=A0ABX2SXY7_9BACL|nr:hypothetical protein [Gemella palaticanis]NYS47150.1 hypothetical protein [Gemella palaticanis]
MKRIYNLILVNILIFILLLLLYLKFFEGIYTYIGLVLLLIINIYIIYQKSNSFDKKEQQKKIMLHKIKNSLSIIMGYNDAFKDEIIDKDQLDKNVNSEIAKIINIIKEEIYTK